MRTLHLKRIVEIWHYQRRRPVEFADVERRTLIRFSLRTRNFQEAKMLAAEHSLALEHAWSEAKERGASLAAEDIATRHAAAVSIQKKRGFAPKPIDAIEDDDLIDRLKPFAFNLRRILLLI